MLHFLASTTNHDRLAGYFEAIGYLTLPNETTPSEAVRIWPKRLKAIKSPIDLNSLCALYSKSLDEWLAKAE
jgi:hypothetical protein